MLQENRRKPLGRASGDDEVDLIALVSALWRGKITIAACFILAVLIGGYYAFVVAIPKYAAAASLEVELQAPPIVDIEAVVSGASTEDAAMNTEIEVIRSRHLLEQLVAELNLAQDPEFNTELRPEPLLSLAPLIDRLRALMGQPVDENATDDEMVLKGTVDTLRNAIRAAVQRDTYIFNIVVTTEDRRKSQTIANSLADLYLRDQVNQKFAATEEAVVWLSGRVSDLEVDLRDRENELKVFRTRADITSIDAVEALNRQLIDARDRLASVLADIAILRARRTTIDEARSSGDFDEVARIADDDVMTRLIQNNVDLSAVEQRTDTIIANLDRELERQQQQADTLSRSVDRLEADVARQSEDLSQFQQLERELQSTQTLYETFLTRLKEATVQRGLQQADGRVLSAAFPGRYVEPRKSVILLLSGILGLMAGTALVFARQFLNKGYRTADELEDDLKISIIGQVPLIPIRKREQLLSYLSEKSTSAASEAIRNLRTSILLAGGGRPPQIIMSTSSLPGEGKTTQSISLAHNFAGLNKKVLLIEGDVRRRTLDEYFKGVSSHSRGLVSALASEDYDISDFVVRDPRLNADVLLGEKSHQNAADLFSSEQFLDFLDSQRVHYDIIIIDTPPVLVVPDARIIGQLADTIIFNVAWDQTSKVQVREALRQLGTVNLEPTGLVLSKIDFSAMKRYGYGGKYGAYGSYGKEYYDT